MKRLSLALALALAIGLSLVPGTAWAGHRHHHGHPGFAGRCCVFIGPGDPFFQHRSLTPSPFFFHRPFILAEPVSPISVEPRLLVVERLSVGVGTGALGLPWPDAVPAKSV